MTNFQKAPDTALVTLVAVMLIAVVFRGLLGRLNILLGVLVGYAYACFQGQVDFKRLKKLLGLVFLNSTRHKLISLFYLCSCR